MANKLGKFLKKSRHSAGLTQVMVQRYFNYSTPQYISNWERGVSKPPLKSIKSLARLYKIDPDEIFNLLLAEIVEIEIKKIKFAFDANM